MSTRTVQDEGGYNQGWAGGRSMQVRAQRRCRLLMSAMTPHPSGRVLEIGCGRGEIARQLATETGMSVMGLDRSEQFIQEARAVAPSTNVQFEALDFRQVEERFGSRQFDYVVGNGILHHLYYELNNALLAMRNLLTDDGRIAFLEPNLHNPYVYLVFTFSKLRSWARLEPDEMAFSRRFAINALREAGFEDIEVQYKDFLVPGVPTWAIRPIVGAGRVAETLPGAKHLAQSLFISAQRSAGM